MKLSKSRFNTKPDKDGTASSASSTVVTPSGDVKSMVLSIVILELPTNWEGHYGVLGS